MPAEINPYRAPESNIDTVATPNGSISQQRALRWVRMAGLIGLVSPGFEYARHLFDFVRHARWEGEMGGFSVFGVILATAGIVLWFVATWWLAYPIIRLASSIFHFVLGRRVPVAHWQQATDEALWPLPYAAATGVLIWFFYSFGSEGEIGNPWRWIAATIVIVSGHAIGAWCYLSIFAAWFRLWRRAARESPRPDSSR